MTRVTHGRDAAKSPNTSPAVPELGIDVARIRALWSASAEHVPATTAAIRRIARVVHDADGVMVAVVEIVPIADVDLWHGQVVARVGESTWRTIGTIERGWFLDSDAQRAASGRHGDCLTVGSDPRGIGCTPSTYEPPDPMFGVVDDHEGDSSDGCGQRAETEG